MDIKEIRNNLKERHGLETQTCDNGVLFKKKYFRNDVEFGQQWRNDELIEMKFSELVAGGHWKEDQEKYPHSKFYFVGDKYMFEFDEQNPKNKCLWCRYDVFWSVFSSEFCMEWLEISRFMIGQVEKYFKLRADTTYDDSLEELYRVEKHFKLRADTTYSW